MSSALAVDNENEMFKIVYGKEISDARTEVDVLQKMFPMEADKTLGKEFSVPVALTAEAGVTYQASDQPAAINTAIGAETKEAKVTGCAVYINGAVTRRAISSSLRSQAAFKRATAYKVYNMLESGKERLEWELLYGQDVRGVGVLQTVAGAGATRTWTINVDSFAPGLWSGKTGTQLDVYDTTGATLRNTLGPITVVSANVDRGVRTISVSGAAADLTAIVATDVLWFRSQKGQQCAGLKNIASQTTGTLFGIDLTKYDLFRGNTHAVGGQISYDAVMNGVSKAVSRGLRGDCVLFLSAETWTPLAKEVKELQQFVNGAQADDSVLGTESIKIKYARGTIDVMAHPLVRLGDGLLFQKDVLDRVGSMDLTFDPEGNGQYFFDVPSSTYKGIILSADQALFCYKPSRTLFFSGITP